MKIEAVRTFPVWSRRANSTCTYLGIRIFKQTWGIMYPISVFSTVSERSNWKLHDYEDLTMAARIKKATYLKTSQ